LKQKKPGQLCYYYYYWPSDELLEKVYQMPYKHQSTSFPGLFPFCQIASREEVESNEVVAKRSVRRKSKGKTYRLKACRRREKLAELAATRGG
jgi:hypothetical protein